jgi:hypothetical protein
VQSTVLGNIGGEWERRKSTTEVDSYYFYNTVTKKSVWALSSATDAPASTTRNKSGGKRNGSSMTASPAKVIKTEKN